MKRHGIVSIVLTVILTLSTPLTGFAVEPSGSDAGVIEETDVDIMDTALTSDDKDLVSTEEYAIPIEAQEENPDVSPEMLEEVDVPDTVVCDNSVMATAEPIQCGENAYYTIDQNGVMRVYGEGSTYDLICKYDWSKDKKMWTPMEPILKLDVKKIIIEEGITKIGDNFFTGQYNCNYSLSSISFPSTLEEIGEYAFYQCKGISSVDINSGNITIGNYAFYCIGVGNVESITISGESCSIGEYAFHMGYRNLKNISISCRSCTIGSHAFSSEVLRNIDHVTPLASVTISAESCSIGDYAFYHGEVLKEITLPENVSSIGDHAFSWCYNLSGLEIPKNIIKLGEGAFYGCKKMESASIPESITIIPAECFSHCDNLTSITIPEGVTEIEEYAFYNCNLASVEIPKGVKKIEASGMMVGSMPAL